MEIAAEVRHARSCPLCADRKVALSPNAVEGAHDKLVIIVVQDRRIDCVSGTQPGRRQHGRMGLRVSVYINQDLHSILKCKGLTVSQGVRRVLGGCRQSDLNLVLAV